jgi:CBS domain-containing protein
MLDLQASVCDLMTANPWAVGLEDSPTDVWTGMLNGGFHHVPVVADEATGRRLLGILSITDLAQAIREVPSEIRETGVILDASLSIAAMMARQVETLPATAKVREVVERFAEGRYHSVPVVDGELLVGIVTTTDLARALLA